MNAIVSDPNKTAAWTYEVFDGQVRWQGPALGSGHSVYMGSNASYIALYRSNQATDAASEDYHCLSELYYISVVVDDLDLIEAQVRKASFISMITTGSNMKSYSIKKFTVTGVPGLVLE